MDHEQIRLRNFCPAVRFGLTCLLITILGGYASSFLHMVDHHSKRDEQPGLSLTDLRGAYHGVRVIAPMVTALEMNHPEELDMEGANPLHPEDRQTLLRWLNSDRISEDYDNLDLGDAAPAEILAINCLNCHSRQATLGEGVGERIPLDYWDDVRSISFSREINPTSVEILTTSTHTHALTMGVLTVVICGLLLATSFPRILVHGSIFLIGAGLLADLGAQWLARLWEPFIWLILVGGGVYGGLASLALVAVMIDLWLPRGVFCRPHSPQS
ncbi:MAG: hypothetical protein JSV91_07870 [Phycisphaerales bacterium]|nr:MAG: hypothetical protein JSV91_07870 [Phycisphaerales bacterium]